MFSRQGLAYQEQHDRAVADLADGISQSLAIAHPVRHLGHGDAAGAVETKWAEFLGERTMRLLVPLLFGILVVVPPQVYVERQVEGAGFNSYLEFYPQFFQGIYPAGNFSWHHLWFLPYLLVYSFVLSPVFLYLRNHPQGGWQRAVQRGLNNGTVWLALAIPLLIVEVGLRPYFPSTHNLIWDWYNFTRYLLLFFYGFLLISVQPDFWKALDRWGGAGLAVGLLTFALMTWFRDQPLRFSGAIYLAAIVEVVNLGAWCVAIFGLAARLLNRPSRLLSYCNAAVYPCYIVHQTILVLCAYRIYDQPWPSLAKFPLLAACTLIGSLLVYELARRLPGIRILLGIKSPVATSIR